MNTLILFRQQEVVLISGRTIEGHCRFVRLPVKRDRGGQILIQPDAKSSEDDFHDQWIDWFCQSYLEAMA